MTAGKPATRVAPAAPVCRVSKLRGIKEMSESGEPRGPGAATTDTVAALSHENLREFPLVRLSDAELVVLIRQGRAEAAAAIWNRYVGMVRGVIRRTIVTRGETEDLVQEVFLRFVDSVDSLRDPKALRPYLYGIAARIAISEVRRRRVRRFVGLSDSGDLPDLPSMSADHESREVLQALARTLDRLGSRERVVFVLHEVNGVEFSEIAAALGLSESTVKRAIARARLRLESYSQREPALLGYLTARAEFEGGAPL